jgi:transcriptional regulator of nitric oxide reductase
VIRTPDQVARDAAAAELRGAGLSYDAIAKRLGVSKSNAWEAVQRAFRDTLREPADQARAVELARLEAAHDAAMAVLARDHVTVSQGRIVKDNDGTPVIDDGPVVQAINAVMRLSESRRKLLGLDAPQRHELTMGEIDAALEDAAAQLALARSEAAEADGTEGTPS